MLILAQSELPMHYKLKCTCTFFNVHSENCKCTVHNQNEDEQNVFTGEDEEDEEKKLPLHIRTCKAITEVKYFIPQPLIIVTSCQCRLID